MARRALPSLLAPLALLALGTGADAQRHPLPRLASASLISFGGVAPTSYRGSYPHYRASRAARTYRTTGCRVWIPGHWERVPRRVTLPARTERVWVEPVWEVRYDPCGRPIRVLVEAGHWDRVVHPGRTVVRYERVWVPGHYR